MVTESKHSSNHPPKGDEHANLAMEVSRLSSLMERLIDRFEIQPTLLSQDDREDKLIAELNDHQKEIRELRQEIERVRRDLNERQKHPSPAIFIPQGPFCTRVSTDIEDKDEIARFVVSKWFLEPGEPQRVFVQASSTVWPLAWWLDMNTAAPAGSVIYTTSAVFHLPMLYRSSPSRHQIYPFCGKSFDYNCGGWLIPTWDTEAIAALVNLFKRDRDPLTTAFLCPLYVSPGQGIGYERIEAACIADAVSCADRVVVIAAGNRVVTSIDEVSHHTRVFAALNETLRNAAEKVTYVISRKDEPLPDIAYELRRSVGRLWWRSSAGWQDVPSSRP